MNESMTEMTGKPRKTARPSDAVTALWPDVSGNSINGLDDAAPGPPKPVFWRTDASTPHKPVMDYFFDRYKTDPVIAKAREYRARLKALEIDTVAPDHQERPAEEWIERVKQAALDLDADDVGVCEWRPEWNFPDRPAPTGRWAIVMAFQHDYDAMTAAPSSETYAEVTVQYGRAGSSATKLANWIRRRGFAADAKTGPMTEDILMIPPAIAAGLGELGKHGSMIHPRFGANFRLSVVMTDLPLLADKPLVFGADAFCLNCQVCRNACPPDAIFDTKQTVRGEQKWYVDFDKCLPYFVDNETCGICLAVCPWSRPGIADTLATKMARRMKRENSA